jgi:hypothetical protein
VCGLVWCGAVWCMFAIRVHVLCSWDRLCVLYGWLPPRSKDGDTSCVVPQLSQVVVFHPAQAAKPYRWLQCTPIHPLKGFCSATALHGQGRHLMRICASNLVDSAAAAAAAWFLLPLICHLCSCRRASSVVGSPAVSGGGGGGNKRRKQRKGATPAGSAPDSTKQQKKVTEEPGSEDDMLQVRAGARAGWVVGWRCPRRDRGAQEGREWWGPVNRRWQQQA